MASLKLQETLQALALSWLVAREAPAFSWLVVAQEALALSWLVAQEALALLWVVIADVQSYGECSNEHPKAVHLLMRRVHLRERLPFIFNTLIFNGCVGSTFLQRECSEVRRRQTCRDYADSLEGLRM